MLARSGLLILWLCFPVAAADLVTVTDAIKTAQSKNPDIRSLEEQVGSAEAKARQALAPAEPSLSLNYNDTPKLFSLGAAASTVYQVSQTIGFPGRAFLNRGVLSDQAKATYHQLRSKRIAVANLVRAAYYNLALALKNLELNQDQRQSYERILEIAKRRYESGGITQVDLLTAQSAIYNNANDLADLQANEKTNRAQLNLLLGNPPEQEIQIESLKMVKLVPFDRDATLKKMTENQPEIRSAMYQQRAAENSYALAWMSLLPDFQFYIGTTYYNVPTASPYSGGASNFTHTYMAGVQITVPLWGVFNEREVINSAARDRATADANLNSQFLVSKTSFETSMQSLQAFEQKLKNYQDHLLPLADQTLELALTGYSSGKIDYQALNDSATAWRTTKNAFYAMVVNYLTTYYSVGQLTGEDFVNE